jgi:hypothetical protein
MTTSKRKHDFTQPSPREKSLAALRDGLKSAFPKDDIIKIDGVDFDKHEFEARVDALLTPEVAAREAHLALEKLVQAKDDNAKPADRFEAAAHAALLNHFGADAKETLAKFGVTPRKERKKLTSAENVVRAARSKETRDKRGSVGPAQKVAFKSDAPPAVNVTKSGRITLTPEATPKSS